MSKSNSQKKALLCTLAFGCGLLFILYMTRQNIPINEILQVYRGLKGEELLLLGMLNMFILLLFSARWWITLRSLKASIPLGPLVAYRLAGFALSYFTPGTQFGGEPLQALLLSRRHRIQPSVAIASVALDKLFEVLFNFTLLIAGIAITLQHGIGQPLKAQNSLLLFSGVWAFPVAYLSFLRMNARPLSWVSVHLPEKKGLRSIKEMLPEIEGECARFLQNKPITILTIAAVSIVSWLAMILEYWLMAEFLGVHLDWVEMVIALTAARLAFLTPLPGAFGALEASQALAMHLLGKSPLIGLSLGLLMRGRDVALGLIGLGVGVHGSLPQFKSRSLPIPEEPMK